MINVDGPEWDEGPLVVKRPVYEAAMKLHAEAKAAGRSQAFSDAEEKSKECKAAGDGAGAVFWDAVFQYLMDWESADAGTEKIILEEGESYYEEGEVIRAGINPPHSDTGFQ